jgi:type IV secretory pathway TrbL component
VGFVVTGNASTRVLVRAVGPSLTAFGIPQDQILLDPTVEVHQGAPNIAANDNSGLNDYAAAIVTVGARIGAAALSASDTRSSSLLITLQPGAYTFIASGKNNTSGIVLVEVYDAD